MTAKTKLPATKRHDIKDPHLYRKLRQGRHLGPRVAARIANAHAAGKLHRGKH